MKNRKRYEDKDFYLEIGVVLGWAKCLKNKVERNVNATCNIAIYASPCW